ncbi:MAG: capsular polysaccharide biosynthesis protein [Alphaproteobacteria bacterium]
MVYLTFSHGIEKIKNIDAFLTAPVTTNTQDPNIESVIGWGKKDNTQKPREYAKNNNLPYISLEDGFIRSLNVGSKDNTPFSLITDNVGIYYDATRPSKLENILNSEGWEKEALLEKSRKIIRMIKENHISKYNHASDIAENEIFKSERKNILIVDQTYNDLSVRYGSNGKEDFLKMYNAALSENPDANIFIKRHPENFSSHKKCYLNKINTNRVTVIQKDINAISLLKKMDKVYTVSSQMGFEALIMRCDVICFGTPFYAGWGLTDDRGAPCERRTKKRTLFELFAASYLLYPTYVNQLTGKKCDILEAINTLIMLKKINEENKGEIFCYGFPRWKRSRIKAFLNADENNIHFISKKRKIKKKTLNQDSKVFIWGSDIPEELASLREEIGFTIRRIEDGFIRSVGLGSDLVIPASLCIDRRGIYYDPSSVSDLEYTLNNYSFDHDLLKRAKKLRTSIIQTNITKYNIGQRETLNFKIAGKKKIILVPGQVEDDASILKGCLEIRDNLSLLRKVSENNPDAFIIYKVHPDVSAKNRKGEVSAIEMVGLCHHVAINTNITDLINAADEIHTMTSQTGFEALIRGKKVVTYGAPFYASWGLTEDFISISRRKRKLSLDELIAGALILYPRYYNWEENQFDIPENVIERFYHRLQNQKDFKKDISYVKRRGTQLHSFLKNIIKSIRD